MAGRTALRSKSAKIVAVDKRTSLLNQMHRSLEDKSVKVEEVILKGSDLTSWLSAQHSEDIFGFDFRQCLKVNDKHTLELFSDFVLERAIEKRLCVVDKHGLGIFESAPIGGNEDVTKKINKISTALAFKSQVLEETTQHWSDTHRVRQNVKFAKDVLLKGTLLHELRYGENPHQIAALYRTSFERIGVTTAKQLQGKLLSYNNINDTDAAFECVSEFDAARTAACVIVKHANPCGVAEDQDIVSAYRKALACDSTSAFGGIVAMNRTLDADAARAITEIFTEVIIAPDATDEAVSIIASKKNLRLLLTGGLPDPRSAGITVKTVAGGLLVQSRDNAVVDDMKLKVVTRRAPTDPELHDLKFAFRVAKHVKSNTIVYAKNLATVGIGAGQMSRVDSARIAARKARDAADEAKLAEPMTKGSVVASDAFFPFADGLLVAIEAGATAVIQPGGSVRDEEVIKAADEHGIAMVFTDVRHFRH